MEIIVTILAFTTAIFLVLYGINRYKLKMVKNERAEYKDALEITKEYLNWMMGFGRRLPGRLPVVVPEQAKQIKQDLIILRRN